MRIVIPTTSHITITEMNDNQDQLSNQTNKTQQDVAQHVRSPTSNTTSSVMTTGSPTNSNTTDSTEKPRQMTLSDKNLDGKNEPERPSSPTEDQLPEEKFEEKNQAEEGLMTDKREEFEATDFHKELVYTDEQGWVLLDKSGNLVQSRKPSSNAVAAPFQPQMQPKSPEQQETTPVSPPREQKVSSDALQPPPSILSQSQVLQVQSNLIKHSLPVEVIKPPKLDKIALQKRVVCLIFFFYDPHKEEFLCHL